MNRVHQQRGAASNVAGHCIKAAGSTQNTGSTYAARKSVYSQCCPVIPDGFLASFENASPTLGSSCLLAGALPSREHVTQSFTFSHTLRTKSVSLSTDVLLYALSTLIWWGSGASLGWWDKEEHDTREQHSLKLIRMFSDADVHIPPPSPKLTANESEAAPVPTQTVGSVLSPKQQAIALTIARSRAGPKLVPRFSVNVEAAGVSKYDSKTGPKFVRRSSWDQNMGGSTLK